MLICTGWIICFFLKASPMVCVILWLISPIPSVAHASQLQFTMHTKGKMITIKSTHHQSHSQSNGMGTKLGLLSVFHTTLKFPLCNTAKISFLCDYAPKEDVSPLLEPYVAIYYMQLISFQQWCELGKINICTKVSMLSSFSAKPSKGHLENAVYVFSYLTSKSNSRLVFDPKELDVIKYYFIECDWLTSMWVHGRQFCTMPQSPFERGWFCVCSWTTSMLVTKWADTWELTLSSSSTMEWLAGFQRSSQQLGPHCLAPNSAS